jgi:hypothetical protein
MKEVAIFIAYSIRNGFGIDKLIRSKRPLADLVGQIARLNPGRYPGINPVRQRKIGNIAFFFSIFFPAAWGRKCFFSSLLIMKWSYSRGLAPKLNIGLRKGIIDMEGHAWLSIDGASFCERSLLSENYSIKLSETGQLIYWYHDD